MRQKEERLERNWERINQADVSSSTKKRALALYTILYQSHLWDYSVFWNPDEDTIEFKFNEWGMKIYSKPHEE